MPPSDYKKAYDTAKKELTDLVELQDKLEKRKIVLRESLEMLAGLCASEDVDIEISAEAAYLLAHANLASEIQAILKAEYPGWQRPHQIKAKLERLGHDFTGRYQNPQAVIHMVLKRMAEAGEIQENRLPEDGKQVYRCPPLWQSIADNMLRNRQSYDNLSALATLTKTEGKKK